MARPLKILSLGQSSSSQCGLLHVANGSIDGGGIRGISSLMILEKVMEQIRQTQKLDHEIKPNEYFDLIGGTSTGGYVTISIAFRLNMIYFIGSIIAIMLGRLEMTVRECIAAYRAVAEAAFTRRFRIPLPGPPRGVYSATALAKAIKSVIKEYCRDMQYVA